MKFKNRPSLLPFHSLVRTLRLLHLCHSASKPRFEGHQVFGSSLPGLLYLTKPFNFTNVHVSVVRIRQLLFLAFPQPDIVCLRLSCERVLESLRRLCWCSAAKIGQLKCLTLDLAGERLNPLCKLSVEWLNFCYSLAAHIGAVDTIPYLLRLALSQVRYPSPWNPCH